MSIDEQEKLDKTAGAILSTSKPNEEPLKRKYTSE